MKVKKVLRQVEYEEVDLELPFYGAEDYSSDHADSDELFTIDMDGKRLGLGKCTSWADRIVEYTIELDPRYLREGDAVGFLDSKLYTLTKGDEAKKEFVDRAKEIYYAMRNVLVSLGEIEADA